MLRNWLDEAVDCTEPNGLCGLLRMAMRPDSCEFVCLSRTRWVPTRMHRVSMCNHLFWAPLNDRRSLKCSVQKGKTLNPAM